MLKLAKMFFSWLFQRRIYCPVCGTVTKHTLIYREYRDNYSVYECGTCNQILYDKDVKHRFEDYREHLWRYQ